MRLFPLPLNVRSLILTLISRFQSRAGPTPYFLFTLEDLTLLLPNPPLCFFYYFWGPVFIRPTRLAPLSNRPVRVPELKKTQLNEKKYSLSLTETTSDILPHLFTSINPPALTFQNICGNPPEILEGSSQGRSIQGPKVSEDNTHTHTHTYLVLSILPTSCAPLQSSLSLDFATR